MVYLLAFTVLTTAFTDSMEIVGRVLARQTEFMRVLIPCYFPVAAWAGGSVSSAAWMEFLIFLIAVVQRLYLSILLPLTKVYMMLVMAGNLAQPDMLSKITGLLKSVIGWGRRSLVGLVLGFQLVQGMVLPYADSVQAAGVNKLLQANSRGGRQRGSCDENGSGSRNSGEEHHGGSSSGGIGRAERCAFIEAGGSFVFVSIRGRGAAASRRQTLYLLYQ